MPDIPKYNGITDPDEHVTSYTCAIKGNDLKDDEIESVLLKKFGETLSKAMIWYQYLPPNSFDSFAMLADAFVNAHAGTIKAEIRKLDLFKVKQRDNEMLWEFVSRFQMERMDLPAVADDWDVQIWASPYEEQERSDQGHSSRGSMSNNGFDRPLGAREAPRLSVYNFNVDAPSIVSAIEHIKDTKCPQPLLSDPTQRDPNLMCKYHGTHVHRTEEC
ncbi:PREDICTED: uncharacterized protein LOC109244057 [Nicotiana attenuata]|uniref:uncharacterized protein LOC109244057 n=1 Tax=Nicotiana attenuata TaxID=49451 RepID=UPI0009055E80|nr:PREDICTED: uncharacterized protein LOC109244057 [Nicotiana attenuata]